MRFEFILILLIPSIIFSTTYPYLQSNELLDMIKINKLIRIIY
jgi:hypothetical protein